MTKMFIPVANNAITKKTNNLIFIFSTETQVKWLTIELRTVNEVRFHFIVPFIIQYNTVHVRKIVKVIYF